MTFLTAAFFFYALPVLVLVRRYTRTGRKPWRPWARWGHAHGIDHAAWALAIDISSALFIGLLTGWPVAVFLGAFIAGVRENSQFIMTSRWDPVGYWYPVIASTAFTILSLGALIAPAFAQTMICAPHAVMIAILEGMGLEPVRVGVSQADGGVQVLIQIWAAGSGEWAAIGTHPNGMACMTHHHIPGQDT